MHGHSKKNLQKILCLCLFILFVFALWKFAVFITETAPAGQIESQSFAETLHIPQCAQKDGHERRDFAGFSICYRELYEQAEWAAEKLTRSKLVKEASRSNNFRSDPLISTGSATPQDYASSGYDRGHLVPAADMAWSNQSMDDSFYMSNMSPQSPGFNRGVWNRLENQVRSWAEEFGTVYTVSGPILENSSYPVIGANEVAVPDYYYKAIAACTDSGEWAAIGFILPNTSSSEPLGVFAVPVDEIEKRCAIDFFAQLPDDAENALEKDFNASFWHLD